MTNPTGLPFEVEPHEYMLLRIPGKRPNTVLVIEAQLFNVAINEYDSPLTYGRKWCYPTLDRARLALLGYLTDDEADEPVGWQRAVDPRGGERRPSDEEPIL